MGIRTIVKQYTSAFYDHIGIIFHRKMLTVLSEDKHFDKNYVEEDYLIEFIKIEMAKFIWQSLMAKGGI